MVRTNKLLQNARQQSTSRSAAEETPRSARAQYEQTQRPHQLLSECGFASSQQKKPPCTNQRKKILESPSAHRNRRHKRQNAQSVRRDTGPHTTFASSTGNDQHPTSNAIRR